MFQISDYYSQVSSYLQLSDHHSLVDDHYLQADEHPRTYDQFQYAILTLLIYKTSAIYI